MLFFLFAHLHVLWIESIFTYPEHFIAFAIVQTFFLLRNFLTFAVGWICFFVFGRHKLACRWKTQFLPCPQATISCRFEMNIDRWNKLPSVFFRSFCMRMTGLKLNTKFDCFHSAKIKGKTLEIRANKRIHLYLFVLGRTKLSELLFNISRQYTGMCKSVQIQSHWISNKTGTFQF